MLRFNKNRLTKGKKTSKPVKTTQTSKEKNTKPVFNLRNIS